MVGFPTRRVGVWIEDAAADRVHLSDPELVTPPSHPESVGLVIVHLPS